MALLDRLRPQPGWKHPDPATRVSAIESLPDSEQTVFATLAREDDSARVRRAAVARLDEVEALAAVAARDADGQVRADAGARLVSLALEDAGPERRRAAAAAVVDDRQIVQLARTSPDADVALDALTRVQEGRALGGIARHALHEDVRLRALQRLEDAGELEAVAMNTEYKDSGLAAVERLQTTAALEAVAERAKNKTVAKRARTIVREREAAEADRRSAAEARERRHTQILEALDLLVRSRDAQRGRAELGRLGEDWEAAGTASSDAAAHYAGARSKAEAHFDGLDREAQAVADARAAHEAALAERRALIDRAQALDAGDDDALNGAIAAVRAEWTALGPFDPATHVQLTRELEAVCARARQRVTARAQAESRRGDIESLATDALQVVEESDLAAVRLRWDELSRRWRELTGGLAVDRETYDRFHAAETRFKTREEGVRAQAAREASENLSRLRSLCDRATALTGMPEASLKDLDHAVRELRAASDHLGPLPSTDLQEGLGGQVKTLLADLLPRLRELRETDDWRRWANAGIQEELCKRVEALREADAHEAAPQLRDLRRQWKAVSAGPRDESNATWQRFKTAADDVQSRCDAHFAKAAAEQAVHQTAKQAIVDQAEALAHSTDWIATADVLKKLQTEWNAIGTPPKEQAAELARRFRAACDTFFRRRKTDLAERKQVWAGNAERKEALCAKAETLALSTDWSSALAAIKQLQAEWKGVGPVRKNRSEALWKRFRGACDTFFDRYGKRHELEHAQRLQEREEACRTLEALAAPAEGAEPPAPETIVPTLEGLWTRWHSAPGLPPEQMQPLRTRFDAALGAVLARHQDQLRGTSFDVQAALDRRKALCEEVEELLEGSAQPGELGGSSAAALAAMLKESLAANTIGGRVNEATKSRASADKVRRAQAQWRELGPVPGEEARTLEGRFHRAVRRFFELHPDQRAQPSPPQHGARRDRPSGPSRPTSRR